MLSAAWVIDEDQILVSHAVGVLLYSPYPYEWVSLVISYGDIEGEVIEWTR
jgi:hypothetical protein